MSKTKVVLKGLATATSATFVGLRYGIPVVQSVMAWSAQKYRKTQRMRFKFLILLFRYQMQQVSQQETILGFAGKYSILKMILIAPVLSSR